MTDIWYQRLSYTRFAQQFFSGKIDRFLLFIQKYSLLLSFIWVLHLQYLWMHNKWKCWSFISLSTILPSTWGSDFHFKNNHINICLLETHILENVSDFHKKGILWTEVTLANWEEILHTVQLQCRSELNFSRSW